MRAAAMMRLSPAQRNYLRLAADGALTASADRTLRILRERGLVEWEGSWPSGTDSGHCSPVVIITDAGRAALGGL